MHKRTISIILIILSVLFSFPFAVFAEEHQHTFGEIENTVDLSGATLPNGDSLPLGLSITKSPCSTLGYECNKVRYSWNFFGRKGSFVDDKNLSVAEVILHWYRWNESFYGKNVDFEKMDTSNAGANIPAAGGRNPKGYGSEGKANVTSSGVEVLWVEPFGLTSGYHSGFYPSAPSKLISGASSSGTQYFSSNAVWVVYYFVAPVSGLYYVGSSGNPYDFGSFSYFYSGKWVSKQLIFSPTSPYFYNTSLSKGSKIYFSVLFSSDVSGCANSPYKYSLNNAPIFVEPLGDSSITTTNNITINNNTWNGNIYTDNSTNLTYIYPEYTTINENNETVTNISENPIIYNNETKQYYTYDSTTNNYYYITYEQQPATPTPSPSPSPSPSPAPTETPSPSESPTPSPSPSPVVPVPSPSPSPTPTPGEDTDEPSGILKVLQDIRTILVNGFAGITEKLGQISGDVSTPETAKPGSSSGNKGQSWWEKLLGKIGDAIVDGLLGAVSTVLKLIFKLFSTILGWIIWAVSRVFDLLPFLPPGLGALLVGGVVVCFVIGIIKFIRG